VSPLSGEQIETGLDRLHALGHDRLRQVGAARAPKTGSVLVQRP
jgi:hypothetical protein